MRVDREVARTKVEETLTQYGISEHDAASTADMVINAQGRGKPSHGLIRIPRYVRGIEAGNVDPDGDIVLVHEETGTATLSGGQRLGPPIALRAIKQAMDRADQTGIGSCGVIEGNHLGMLGYYTEQMRAAGFIGLALTNTEPALAPYGGREAILGTNPIAIGLPTEPPFNLDMSTASIPRGTLERSLVQGEQLPAGCALDAEGTPTQDPEKALAGTILPFGGPKGSGLSIAVEVLSGGLVGAAMGHAVTGTYHTEAECTKGDLFVAIDPQAFGVTDFGERAGRFFRDLKDSSCRPDVDSISVPGEQTWGMDLPDTLQVEPDTWNTIERLADR